MSTETGRSLEVGIDRGPDLRRGMSPPAGPTVIDFDPPAGYPGSMVTINGTGFSTTWHDNDVTIGGEPAIVVDAGAERLTVLAGAATATGAVKVKVGGLTAVGPHDFTALAYPDAGKGGDGPPMIFEGAGLGQRGDVPATGTLKVMVALVTPSDLTPANPAQARQAVVDAWGKVHTFYDQVTYGTLDVQADAPSSWTALTGSTADYVTFSGDTESPNIRSAALPRLMAEAAKTCQDAGFNLNNYQLLACVLYLDGQFIRARGGWSRQSFSYSDGAGTNINITLNQPINLLAIQESADWGRFAHETGHNIVAAPYFGSSPGAAVLGEDVYASDLVDPTAASAQTSRSWATMMTIPASPPITWTSSATTGRATSSTFSGTATPSARTWSWWPTALPRTPRAPGTSHQDPGRQRPLLLHRSSTATRRNQPGVR